MIALLIISNIITLMYVELDKIREPIEMITFLTFMYVVVKLMLVKFY